jgi:hypothetical protein
MTYDSLQQLMITVAWNPGAFRLMQVLPMEMKFDTAFYVSTVLQPLAEWRSSSPSILDRRVIAHSHNARAEISRKVAECLGHHRMKRAPIRPIRPMWHH